MRQEPSPPNGPQQRRPAHPRRLVGGKKHTPVNNPHGRGRIRSARVLWIGKRWLRREIVWGFIQGIEAGQLGMDTWWFPFWWRPSRAAALPVAACLPCLGTIGRIIWPLFSQHQQASGAITRPSLTVTAPAAGLWYRDSRPGCLGSQAATRPPPPQATCRRHGIHQTHPVPDVIKKQCSCCLAFHEMALIKLTLGLHVLCKSRFDCSIVLYTRTTGNFNLQVSCPVLCWGIQASANHNKGQRRGKRMRLNQYTHCVLKAKKKMYVQK